ncbi:toxin-antitoxin system YwqK family antitoxin [Ferruginibacter sp.]
MAHQARFQSSISILLLTMLFTGCKHTGKPAPGYSSARSINENTPGLHADNGILYLKDSLYTGTVYTLFPNNDTAAIMHFNQGREDGTWQKRYPGNQLQEIRTFTNGSKTGEYTAWWPNGNKKLLYNFSNDEYEGTCSEWNETGQLVKESNYKAGYENGPQKLFYNNGKIHSNYVVINGRRFGLLGTKNCINVSDSIFNK